MSIIKDETLPWLVYQFAGETWILHSSFKQRNSAENCLKLVKQHVPNIEFKLVFNTSFEATNQG